MTFIWVQEAERKEGIHRAKITRKLVFQVAMHISARTLRNKVDGKGLVAACQMKGHGEGYGEVG